MNNRFIQFTNFYIFISFSFIVEVLFKVALYTKGSTIY